MQGNFYLYPLTGPASSTDNAIATYKGTGGHVVQNSSVTVNSGTIRAANGAVGAPSFSFTSDATTGLYYAGSNQFGISSGGVSLLRSIAGPGIEIGTSGGRSVQIGSSGGVEQLSIINSGGTTGLNFKDTGVISTSITNGSITLTPSGTGGILSGRVGTAANPAFAFSNEVNTGIYQPTANWMAFSVQGSVAGIFVGQNLLLGGLAINGTGVLQFPAGSANTTSGLSFAADTFIYREAQGVIHIDSTANTLQRLAFSNNGNLQGRVDLASGVMTLATNGATSIILATNNTTALTLDSSQNATFAQDVVGAAGKQIRSFGNISLGTNAANSGVFRAGNAAGGVNWRNAANSANHSLDVNATDILTWTGATDVATSGTRGAVQILPTYNQASGTAANTDLLINRTQTAVGSGVQRLIDAQVASVSKFYVDNTGLGFANGGFNVANGAAFYWNTRSQFLSPSDGVIQMANLAGTDFTRLQFGGTTSSFPAIKRSSATLLFRLADDSSNADIQAQGGTFTGEIFGSGAGFRTNGGYVINAANQAVLDYSSGARLIGFGADASTNGIFSIQSKRSDGSNTLTFLSFDSAGAATLLKTVTSYNGIATAGNGVVTVQGAARATAQTGANASVATYTVGASDASFEVSANILVTTATTHAFTCTCAYTDEGNTARTITFTFSNVGGTLLTSIANTGGAVPYEGVPLHIRAKASTSITIATTGTFTSVVYNVEGNIRKIA